MAITYLGKLKKYLTNVKLKELVPNPEKATETKFTKALMKHLQSNGEKVTYEKPVGIMKFTVDLDYEDGRACVELKLASKLVGINGTVSTSEVQRLLGQVYYYKQYYKDVVNVVLVVVIGDGIMKDNPMMKEISKHVRKMGAEFYYLPF